MADEDGTHIVDFGASDMALRVAAFDWAQTPLGPLNEWPIELMTVVRQILDSHFPAAVIWGRELTTIYNDGFRPILGEKPEALGRSFAEIWSETWAEIAPIAERAYRGEATYIEDFQIVTNRLGRDEHAWFTFCYSPLRLSDGTVAGMLDTVIETTGTVKARAEMSLLNRELSHRLKNSLMLVQAIASQTFRSAGDRETVGVFQERLYTLAGAHDILLQQEWTRASFHQVVRDTLSPLDGLTQIAFEGPDFVIGSHATLTLAMILHELATNASKYGALAEPEGRISLHWTMRGEKLFLRWHESGGPRVQEPLTLGFGSALIDSGFDGSRSIRRYPPSGFELDFELPLEVLAN